MAARSRGGHDLQASRRTRARSEAPRHPAAARGAGGQATPRAGRSASRPPPDACPIRRKSSAGCPGSSASRDPNVVLHRLEQEENKAEAEYDQLMARLSDPDDRQIAEEAMLEERDHAVVLRTLAGGNDSDAAIDARHHPRPRALARPRHRLDRRRDLRRQRRPRRRLRHRLGHGRLHRRQRGRARGRPRRHAGQRAVDGRRRVSRRRSRSARSTSRKSRASGPKSKRTRTKSCSSSSCSIS